MVFRVRKFGALPPPWPPGLCIWPPNSEVWPFLQLRRSPQCPFQIYRLAVHPLLDYLHTPPCTFFQPIQGSSISRSNIPGGVQTPSFHTKLGEGGSSMSWLLLGALAPSSLGRSAPYSFGIFPLCTVATATRAAADTLAQFPQDAMAILV